MAGVSSHVASQAGAVFLSLVQVFGFWSPATGGGDSPPQALMSPSVPGCVDDFDRVVEPQTGVTAGWGDGPLGAWQYSAGSTAGTWEVDGNAALHTAASTGGTFAALDAQSHLGVGTHVELELLVQWRVDTDPADNSWVFEAYLSDGLGLSGDYVGVGLQGFGVDDAIINAGFSYAPWSDFYNSAPGYPRPMHHKDLWLRLLVDEYGVYARVWEDGQPEPVTTGGVVPSVGGRGERWHTYEVSSGGLPARSWDYVELRLSGGSDVTAVDSVRFVTPCALTLLFVHGWSGTFQALEAGFIDLLDPLREFYPGRVVMFEHFQDRGYRQPDGTCANPRPLPSVEEPNGGMPVDLEGSELTICDSQADMALNAVALDSTIRDLYASPGGKVVIVVNSGGAPIVRGMLAYSIERDDGVAETMVDSVMVLEGSNDGAWVARIGTAALDVTAFLAEENAWGVEVDLNRPAGRDLVPESPWYEWTNPVPARLPNLPYYNVTGEIHVALRPCLLGACWEVARDHWGDFIMLEGTDDPYDTPFEGGLDS